MQEKAKKTKKPSNTLTLKLFFTVGAVLVLFGVIIYLSCWMLFSAYASLRTENSLSDTANAIVLYTNALEPIPDELPEESEKFEESEEPPEPEEPEPFDRIAELLRRTQEEDNRFLEEIAIRFDVVIYDKETAPGSAVLYYSSGSRRVVLEKAVETPASKNEYGEFYYKFFQEGGRQYFVYEREYEAEGGAVYLIEIRDAASTNWIRDYVNSFMIWAVLAALVLSLLLAFFFSWQTARPLLKINSAAKSIAALDFDYKVTLKRRDEIGQLADSVNEISDKLRQAIDELKDKNERLERELARERETDAMRKKFVADVSHELKTPLAVIQGYSEALGMGVGSEQKRAHYAGVIGDETKRMNKLVLDLLDLSQYQSGTYKLERKNFDIGKLLKAIAAKQEQIMLSRGVSFKYHADSAEINADPGRIEQVINNFLSNAVFHASGKNEVRLVGVKEPGGYKVKVYNSGNSLSEEEKEKIWDAFYRSDTARSRGEGRHGIGLSIVKAILDLHQARYGVNNVKDGVEFYFIMQN